MSETVSLANRHLPASSAGVHASQYLPYFNRMFLFPPFTLGNKSFKDALSL
jgi:hypothetical protein